MKLRSKLTLFNTFSKLLIVLVFIIILPFVINYISLRDVDKKLYQKKEKVLDEIKELGIETFIPINTDSSFGSYNILKEEFILIEPLEEFIEADTIENTLRKVEDEIVEYRIMSHAFSIKNKPYLLEIGKSVESLDELNEPLQNFAFAVFLSMIFLTVLSDVAFNSIQLKPLGWIVNKLKNIKHPSSFSFSKVKTGTDDFVYLDESINEMMRKLQKTFSQEREFIANASHELLTPVSVLQTRLDNLMQEESLSQTALIKIAESQKTLAKLKNIINSLLLISRIENEQYLKEEEVNIKEIINEVMEELELPVKEKELNITVQLKTEINIKGNKSLLFIMLFNLIKNAVKYTAAEGTINIQTDIADEKAALLIEDTGVGINYKDIPEIFNRFSRFEEKEHGFGLGLPIAKTIADFHRIEIKVVSEKNKGTRFALLFPVN